MHGTFSVLQNIQTGSGAHPASYSMGSGVLTRGLKQPEREVYYSSPSSAESKKEWRYNSLPRRHLRDVDGKKFSFYLATVSTHEIHVPWHKTNFLR